MDGPIFLTNILECRAILLAPSPIYAVSTVICFALLKIFLGHLRKLYLLNWINASF